MGLNTAKKEKDYNRRVLRLGHAVVVRLRSREINRQI